MARFFLRLIGGLSDVLFIPVCIGFSVMFGIYIGYSSDFDEAIKLESVRLILHPDFAYNFVFLSLLFPVVSTICHLLIRRLDNQGGNNA